MSLLKRMFGGASLDDHRAEAEAHFEARRFGQAKLAFEKAFDKAKGESAEVRSTIAARIDASRDGIARGRIATAEEHVATGALDLARAELEGAIEVAADAKLAAEAQELLYGMERVEAVTAAEEVVLTDADKLATIAGTWEAAQDEEYGEYGDAMNEALLALFGEEPKSARPLLEAILEDAEAPRYLWLEVGRARMLDEDDEGSEEAFRTFLELLEDDEGGEGRLAAHANLARIADARGDTDGAVAELEDAAAFFDEDPRPLLMLGRYLREKERAPEAVEVLRMAADLMGMRPDWAILEELGVALHEAGDKANAIGVFEESIAFLTSQKITNFPTRTATMLAKLHEEAGNLERAADLFRVLSQGSDRQNHIHYHYEAARLLRELELDGEARRMLERALALAEDDSADQKKINEALEALREI
jgi:tetratricopeptide (TPR) repeat protein